jgi:hypothetical protein
MLFKLETQPQEEVEIIQDSKINNRIKDVAVVAHLKCK